MGPGKPGPPKGKRYGGRQKGTKNKKTLIVERMAEDAILNGAALDKEKLDAGHARALVNAPGRGPMNIGGLDVSMLDHKQRLDLASDIAWRMFIKEKKTAKKRERLDFAVRIDSIAIQYTHPRLSVQKVIDAPRGDDVMEITLVADGRIDRVINGEAVEVGNGKANGHGPTKTNGNAGNGHAS